MSKNNLRQVRAIFLEARQVPLARRFSFLDHVCGRDSDLRNEVESLLALDRPETFISCAVVSAGNSDAAMVGKTSPCEARILFNNRHIRIVPLCGGSLIIGRDSKVAIHLQHRKVSRHHAELACDAQGVWWLSDLGSRNGTSLNDKEIQSRVQIATGDVIRILRFTIELA